jgi:hypothetical protein
VESALPFWLQLATGSSGAPAGARRPALDRSLPEKEVAPEDERPHPGTGERRGRVLTGLAGRQRRVKNLRHRRVAGLQPVPAATTRGSEDGEGGAEYPMAGCGDKLGRQLPRQVGPEQPSRRTARCRAAMDRSGGSSESDVLASAIGGRAGRITGCRANKVCLACWLFFRGGRS